MVTGGDIGGTPENWGTPVGYGTIKKTGTKSKMSRMKLGIDKSE